MPRKYPQSLKKLASRYGISRYEVSAMVKRLGYQGAVHHWESAKGNEVAL